MNFAAKPKFEFSADSMTAEDKSGLAVWRYQVEKYGEPVEKIVRQRFDSFDAAYGINQLIIDAWQAGIETGLERACNAVDSAMRQFR